MRMRALVRQLMKLNSGGGRFTVAAALCLSIAGFARADWVEAFDGGLTQPWTFFVVDNEGEEPTTGVPAVTVVPASGGGAYLRMNHSTVANTNGGGGAAAAVGIVDQTFTNGVVRAVVNATPGDGQRNFLAVFARASASTGRGYLLGVDFRSGDLVLQLADSLAGQALTLSSSPIPGFAAGKSYLVQLTLNGSSLSGRVSAVGNATTLATVTATDSTVTSGRAGILVRTGYSAEGAPLDKIVGTFDNASLMIQSGTGSVPAPQSVTPILPRTRGIPPIIFADDLMVSSLDNSAKERLDFQVLGVVRGAIVRLYANNTIIAEQFSGPGGRVLIRTNGVNVLTDGVYDVRASQSVQGFESPLLDAFTLRVDTIAPAKPGVPDLVIESDTGVSDTDNVTRAPELVLTGTAEPGAAIALLLNNRPAKNFTTTTADEDGVWSFTYPSGRKGGAFRFSVLAFDSVGNFSQASETLTVTALVKAPKAPQKLALAIEDRDPPPVRQKHAYTNNPMPTITGKGIAGATVRVTVAGTGVEFGTATVLSNKTWSVTLNRALQQGDSLIGATQIDAAGNESTVSKLMKLTYQAPLEGAVAARGQLSLDEAPAHANIRIDAGRFDVDGDGRVTMHDVAAVVAWIGREDFPIEADVDEDGDVDADDLAAVSVMVGR